MSASVRKLFDQKRPPEGHAEFSFVRHWKTLSLPIREHCARQHVTFSAVNNSNGEILESISPPWYNGDKKSMINRWLRLIFIALFFERLQLYLPPVDFDNVLTPSVKRQDFNVIFPWQKVNRFRGKTPRRMKIPANRWFIIFLSLFTQNTSIPRGNLHKRLP